MVAKSIAKMYTNIHKPTDYDIKRSFWAALTAMNDCRSQCAWQCAAVCPAERERDPSGCRAWPRGAGSGASTYPPRWLRKKPLNFTRRPYRPPHCRVDASSLVFLFRHCASSRI